MRASQRARDAAARLCIRSAAPRSRELPPERSPSRSGCRKTAGGQGLWWINDITLVRTVTLSLYLQQPFTGQVPLVDVAISGAAKEDVSVHGQRLHAVLMRRLEGVAGADAALGAFSHFMHLKKQKRRRDRSSPPALSGIGLKEIKARIHFHQASVKAYCLTLI